jgi:hypothetical protein
MTNNAIDDLAKTVRAAYSLIRSLYETAKAGHPVVYIIPKLYDGKQGVETDDGVCLEKDIPPLWPKLAKKFVTLEIDPEAYISIQFDARDIAHRPPEPNHLFSEQCLKHWEKFKHAKGDEIRTLLDVNKNVFEQNVSYLEHQGIKKLDAVMRIVHSRQRGWSSSRKSPKRLNTRLLFSFIFSRMNTRRTGRICYRKRS